MIYVFDSDVLINLFRNYYPRIFPSLWQKFEGYVDTGQIISVREVLNEISGRSDPLSTWAKTKTTIFHQPTTDEMAFIAQIFQVNHFQSLVRAEQRLSGKPVADPFVIAKASTINGCVVTDEHNKPNAARIPNICDHFGVKCLNLEGFMDQEKWTF